MADMNEEQIAVYAKKAVETAIKEGYIVIPENKELAGRTMSDEFRNALTTARTENALKPMPGRADFISKTEGNFEKSLNEMPSGAAMRYSDSSARANALLSAANDAKKELAKENPKIDKIMTRPAVGMIVKTPLEKTPIMQLPVETMNKEKGQFRLAKR